jgi:hypothetical protein
MHSHTIIPTPSNLVYSKDFFEINKQTVLVFSNNADKPTVLFF